MKELARDIKIFLNNKVYMLILGMAAACSYGFAVTHYAIGMDDTAVPLYFEEGLAPYVGRWTLFIINKIFHIADFVPWMTELVSVLLLMLSVTVWCVLFYRITRRKIKVPAGACGLVAGIFISCPLISEVFVFYLHNGICIGYGLTALSLLLLLESLRSGNKGTGKKRFLSLLVSALLLTTALGCYESFAVVFGIGAILLLFLIRLVYGKKAGESEYDGRLVPWMVSCLGVGGVSLVLRMMILKIIGICWHLERFDAMDINYRSFFAGFASLFTDRAEMMMELKRFWLKYYLNAFVYLPITVLVLALLLIGICSIWYGIRKRDIVLPLCVMAIVLIPVFMCVLEGLATRYRTGQYIPLLGAFGAFLVLLWVYHDSKMKKVVQIIAFALLTILLYNQCADMNQWFYLDYRKYEYTREVLEQVAYDLESNYDTSKPLIFRGANKVPYEVAQDDYVSFNSPGYRMISRISDLVDPHLKEKYYAENGRGYIISEGPVTSTLQWGLTAFDGTAGQLVRFLQMQGHSFVYEKDLQKIDDAEHIREETRMPAYPRAGYIMECPEYIIINLESE